jgi:hypothetical protein
LRHRLVSGHCFNHTSYMFSSSHQRT